MITLGIDRVKRWHHLSFRPFLFRNKMLLPFPQMTLLRVTVFTALLLLRPSLQTSPKRTLFIGGLFGIDTSGGGWNSAGIIPAVRMAFDDINNSSEVLRNYRLELLVKDAKVCVAR